MVSLSYLVPAQALMVVVPKDDALEVEAFIENKDIGFVRADQEAEIKIETFSYTKYGTIRAKGRRCPTTRSTTKNAA